MSVRKARLSPPAPRLVGTDQVVEVFQTNPAAHARRLARTARRKETKTQFALWLLIWMLRALDDTPLTIIIVVFLMVGHTHNKLGRLFSRILVAPRGKASFTVEGMLRRVPETLPHTVL